MRYDENFKKEAISLAMDSDRTICEVANNLGINEKTLYNWVGAAKRSKYLNENPEALKAGCAEAKLKKVLKELERVKEERDILKKAAIFFAQEK